MKKIISIVVTVIILIVCARGVFSCLNDSGSKSQPQKQEQSQKETQPQKTTPTPSAQSSGKTVQNPGQVKTPAVPVSKTPKAPSTQGEKDALKKANEYLAYMPLSKHALKEQLEFDEIPVADITFVIDNCGVNWNEQAEKAAKEYMKSKKYSKNKLIEILKDDGFTQSQAEYGASNAVAK